MLSFAAPFEQAGEAATFSRDFEAVELSLGKEDDGMMTLPLKANKSLLVDMLKHFGFSTAFSLRNNRFKIVIFVHKQNLFVIVDLKTKVKVELKGFHYLEI